MKKIFFLFLVTVLVGSAYSQCDHLKYMDNCKEHLNEDHFQFIKEFEIYSKNGEPVEHSIMLSTMADYEYWFTGDDWSHHTMTATLYDMDHKKISSNHPSDKEYFHVIKFHPEKNGIYYIKFEFQEGESFCGSAVLGFHKHTQK